MNDRNDEKTSGSPNPQVKRAAQVTIFVIDSFSGEQELRTSECPFDLDFARSLCHLCARQGLECDLPAETRARYTVVACEIRDLAAPLLEDDDEGAR